MPGRLDPKIAGLAVVAAGPDTDLQDAITTAYEWHSDGGSAMYAFASTGGNLVDDQQRQQLLKEIQDCANYVQGNAASIDGGKYPEYAEDTEKAQGLKISTSQYQLQRFENLAQAAAQAANPVTAASHKRADFDASGATEESLDLFLYNTSELYPQAQSIRKALSNRIDKDNYDPNLAWRLWLAWVVAGAKQYAREFPEIGLWSQAFPVSVQQALAKSIAKDEEKAIRSGEYKEMADYHFQGDTSDVPPPVTASSKEAKVLISPEVFQRAQDECDSMLKQVGGQGSELEGKLTKIQYELNKVKTSGNGDLAYMLDDEINPQTAMWAQKLIKALSSLKQEAAGAVVHQAPPGNIQNLVASVAVKEAGFGEDSLKALVQFARTHKQQLQQVMQAQGPQAVAQALAQLPGTENSAPRVAPAFVQWLSGQMNDSNFVGMLESVLTKKASVDNEAVQLTSGALALAGLKAGSVSAKGSLVTIRGLKVNIAALNTTAKIASLYGVQVKLAAEYTTPGVQPDEFPEPPRLEPEGIMHTAAPSAAGNHAGAGNPVNPTGAAPDPLPAGQPQGTVPPAPEQEPAVPAVAPTGYGQGAAGEAYGQKKAGTGPWSRRQAPYTDAGRAKTSEPNPMDGEGGATLKAYKFGNPKPLMEQEENRSAALVEAEHLMTNPEIQKIEVSILWGGQWSTTNVWERSAPEAEWDEQAAHEMYRTTHEPEDDLPGSGVTAAFYTEEDDEAPDSECPQCGGPLMPMGTLGNLQHSRCRNCGAQFSHKVAKVAADGTLVGTLAEIESMLSSTQELADKAVAQARLQSIPTLITNVERLNAKVYEGLMAVRTAKVEAQDHPSPAGDKPAEGLTPVTSSTEGTIDDRIKALGVIHQGQGTRPHDGPGTLERAGMALVNGIDKAKDLFTKKKATFPTGEEPPYQPTPEDEASKQQIHDQRNPPKAQGPNPDYIGDIMAPLTAGLVLAEAAPVFDATTAQQWLEAIKAGVQAPVVAGYISTLGGATRAAIMLSISTDPKEAWPNHIFENSTCAKVSLDYTGVLKVITYAVRTADGGFGKLSFRQIRVDSPEKAVLKLNNLVQALLAAKSGPPKIASEKITKCVDCGRPGTVSAMEGNPAGAGYLCPGCFAKRDKQDKKTSAQLAKGPDASTGDSVENAIDFINANGADMDEYTVQQLREALGSAGYTQQIVDKAITDLLGNEALQALATPVKSLLGS